MNRPPEPRLVEWADELAELLARRCAEPGRWHRAFATEPAPVDFEGDWARADDGMKIAVYAAWRAVKRQYLDAGGDPAALLAGADDPARLVVVTGAPGTVPDLDATPTTRRLYGLALELALEVGAEMRERWSDRIPAGLPQLKQQRRQRAVVQALQTQRPGETVADMLERAGVSRAQGYRIMGDKTKA